MKRGPFQINVLEKGQLDSARNAVLSSKVEGSTTIISIVPEGTTVKKDDLVIELDSSALVEKERQQEIAVTQAQSAKQSAEKEVEIQKTQNESDISAAKLKLELAEIDLRKFEEGDSKQQKNELQSQVSLQEQKAAQALETLEFTKRLVKKGYKTQNDLEQARITYETEKTNLAVAKDKLNVLDNFTYGRTVTELQANAKEFARELKRVELKGQAALSQKETDLLARTRTLEVEEDKHERLKAQIAVCKIVAPQDGQVIYANNRDGRSSETVLIETGASVRERQPLVTLPDLTKMKVNARIHETRISLIRPGMPVKVKVDAFNEEDFHGVVDTVASVPSSTGSSFMRDIKEYEAAVLLTDDPEKVSRLRPGLNANLEILVDSRDDVLQCPMQAILTVVGKQFAFVIHGDKVERRDVEIGQASERMIEVKSGLKEGEQVVLNPRTHFEKELKELEGELIKKQASEKPPADSTPPAAGTGEPKSPGSPAGGPGRAPGAGGPTGNGPPTGSEGRPPGGGMNPSARFKEMDKNSDGKLASDEMPDRMKEMATRWDKDGDGNLSLDEYTTGIASFGGGRPGGNRPGGGRPVSPGGEATGGSGG